MRQLCVHRDMKHAGSLESTQEARVALQTSRVQHAGVVRPVVRLSFGVSVRSSTYDHMSMNAR